MSVTLQRPSFLKSCIEVKVKRGKFYIILVIDTSSSMTGQPIAQLNKGGRDLEPVLKKVQSENPSVPILVRVLAFNSDATWQSSGWIEAAKFRWVDVTTGGSTALGLALTEVAAALDGEMLGSTKIPPHIVLLTDGGPTDDWEGPFAALINQKPYGEASVRSAIACGYANTDMLKQFIGDSGGILAEADNAEQIREAIKVLVPSVAEHGSRAPGAEKTLQEEFDDQMKNETGKGHEDDGNDNGVATLY